jgi:peptidoglycan biosynthesis protein MviN/MurJ (putative lipid II flippase)
VPSIPARRAYSCPNAVGPFHYDLAKHKMQNLVQHNWRRYWAVMKQLLMERTLIYNFVNAMQIFLGFISQFLLARYFGASLFTDSYIMSAIIVDFISKIGSSFTEMFIQYYNDLRVFDNKQEKLFYQSVFNLSILIGVLIFITSIVFMDPIIKLFVSGFDRERIMVLKSLLGILVFSLIWSRLKEINNSLINAEMRFIIPYLLGLLTPMSNITALLFFSRDYGIYSIAISTLLSDMIILSFQQVYILKILKIGLGRVFWHYKLKEFIKKSLSLKIGNQLWDFKDLIVSNILSFSPHGTVSLYFYSFRIITVLFMVTNLPSLQIFSSIISRLAAEKDFISMRMLLKKTMMRSTISFLIVTILFAISLPKILPLFLGYKFSMEDINAVHHMFLSLIPFYIILTMEMPFLNIIIALKLSFKVIVINTIFVMVFCIFAFLLRTVLEIYTIPVSLMIAQSQNLILYAMNVQKFFKRTLA